MLQIFSEVPTEGPESLPPYWRTMAEGLKRLEHHDTAAAFLMAARQLENAIEQFESETLNLQEAAEASGYSADHLGLLVRQGKLQNAGRPGAPRIARRDLPRKRRTGRQEVVDDGREELSSNRQVVESIVAEGAA